MYLASAPLFALPRTELFCEDLVPSSTPHDSEDEADDMHRHEARFRHKADTWGLGKSIKSHVVERAVGVAGRPRAWTQRSSEAEVSGLHRGSVSPSVSRS